MTIHWVACVLAISAVLPASTGAAGRTVSLKEARRLAYLALPGETKKLPGLTLLPNAAPHGCITFDVLWSNPGPGSVHVTFYCVNLHTAEVWDEDCERVTSAALGQAQERIRKRLGLPDTEELGPKGTPACCRVEKATGRRNRSSGEQRQR